jgi:hypothetical protein
MNVTKVKLSALEQELVQNSELFLTKFAVIEKVYQLFGSLAKQYSQIWPHSSIPKIAKGERYLQQPWVMLDYPRIFTPTNSFAVRSFFWWGHFFSITLVVAGKQKEELLLALQNLPASFQSWYLGIHTDPWQHHFGVDNYRLLASIPKQRYVQYLDELDYVKLATKIPLSQWDEAYHFFSTNFNAIKTLTA